MFGWRGEMCRLIMICLLVAIENITFLFFSFLYAFYLAFSFLVLVCLVGLEESIFFCFFLF